jgi:hypothetical protein
MATADYTTPHVITSDYDTTNFYSTSTTTDVLTLDEMLRQRYIGEIINNETISAISNDIYRHYQQQTNFGYTNTTTINNNSIFVNGTNTTYYPFTFDTDNNICAYDSESYKKEAKKQKLKSNLLIFVKSRASNDFLKNMPENEKTALETLREEVSEIEFRRYLKYGFVLVRSKSGKTYQVFRNRSHTKVWFNGKVIEEVCVRIKDSNIPLTDNVIAFKTLIEFDEEEFKKLGNVFKMAIAA